MDEVVETPPSPTTDTPSTDPPSTDTPAPGPAPAPETEPVPEATPQSAPDGEAPDEAPDGEAADGEAADGEDTDVSDVSDVSEDDTPGDDQAEGKTSSEFEVLHSALSPPTQGGLRSAEPGSRESVIPNPGEAGYIASVFQVRGVYDYLVDFVTDEEPQVGGKAAVTKFLLSGLPKSVLATVWDRVDTEKAGVLTHPQVLSALKLIAIVQRGAPVLDPIPDGFYLDPPNNSTLLQPPFLEGMEWPEFDEDELVEYFTALDAQVQAQAEEAQPQPQQSDGGQDESTQQADSGLLLPPGSSSPPPAPFMSEDDRRASTQQLPLMPERPPRGASVGAKNTSGDDTSAATSTKAGNDGSDTSDASTPVLPPRGSTNPKQTSTASSAVSGSSSSSSRHVSISTPVTKKGMMRKHTEYLVTTTPPDVSVSRRYSDFVWLRERLVTLYPYRIVPQLPAKQFAGRFEDIFIQNRMRGLEKFLVALMERSHVFRWEDLEGFLTITDPKAFSKLKKEKLEKLDDEFVFSTTSRSAGDSLPPNAADVVDTIEGQLATFRTRIEPVVEVADALATKQAELANEWSRFTDAFGAWATPQGIPLLWAPEGDRVSSVMGELTITASALAQTSTEHFTDQQLHFADVLREVLSDAQSLIEVFSAAALPFTKLAGSEKKTEDAQAKLVALQKKGNAKEITKQEAAVAHHQEKLEYRILWCAFARKCILDEVVFFRTALGVRMSSIFTTYTGIECELASRVLSIWDSLGQAYQNA